MLSKSWMRYVVVNKVGEFLNDEYGIYTKDVSHASMYWKLQDASNVADIYGGIVMDVRLTLEEQE